MTVLVPSRGMLFGFPRCRPKAKNPCFDPNDTTQGWPFAPRAAEVAESGLGAGAGYTQNLINPGTPPLGFSFWKLLNTYVATVPEPSNQNEAPTIGETCLFPIPL